MKTRLQMEMYYVREYTPTCRCILHYVNSKCCVWKQNLCIAP